MGRDVVDQPDRPAGVAAFVDRAAIREALVAYLSAVQHHDWERVEEAFAPRATLDYGTPGVTSVADNIRLLRAGVDRFVARSTLIGMHVVVTVDGDTAQSRSSAFTAHTSAVGPTVPTRMSVVVYADQWMRCTDGRWRITDRVVHHDLKGWLQLR